MKTLFMIGFMTVTTSPGLFDGVAPADTIPPCGLYLVQESASQTLSDTQLQLAVSQAMQTSPLTANSQIVVHVTKGEVTLEGAAINQLALREATRLAQTVLGVKDIRNRLSVIDTQTAGAPPPR